MQRHLKYLCSSVFICGSLLLLSGCAHQPPPTKAYEGPTETMEEVIQKINANNSRIPSLWAHIGGASMDVEWVDEKNRHQSQVLGGTLLYRAPREVKLVGTHDVAGTVFELGSNPTVYWLRIGPKDNAEAWWGRYKYLGADCVQPIPIRPDLLLSVLGVSTININLLDEPVPVMRFNNKADAYMFIWNTRLPDRWVAVKEVWYDRATKRPKVVVLFDVNGRVVLEAHLGQHEPVKLPDVAQDRCPTIATVYDVTMPENKAHLHLKLSRLALSEGGAPNDLTFRFNPKNADVPKVNQLDEACGP